MLGQFLQLGEQPYSAQDAEWDAFVAAHPHGSVLQTTAWARLKGRFGWQGYRVWVRHEGKLIAGAQILFKSAVFRLFRLGYIPHGPLVDWHNDELVTVLLHQIDLAAYNHRASLMKMEPLLWQTSSADFAALCQKHALLPTDDTIQPPRTMLIDLTRDEEAILASMHSKTRYNIRLAEKKEVVVRQGSSADWPTFAQLMQITGQRNQFGTHDSLYYRDAFDFFQPHGNVVMLIAEYMGKPLAGAMIFRNGHKADYLFGGSNNDERNRMPTYAIQWAAIRWAKAQGCTQYDLWGLPDAEPDQLEAEFEQRSDGLWGVYRFKRGFQGEIRRTVGCVDRVYNRLFYRLYQWERQRQKAR